MDFSPAWIGFEALNRTLSPYEFNPLAINPLADLLRDVVDVDRRWRARVGVGHLAHGVISLAVVAAGRVGSGHPEMTPPSHFHHVRDTTPRATGRALR